MAQQNSLKRHCLNFRQFALFVSLLVLTVTAIFTCGVRQGERSTEYIWETVKEDLKYDAKHDKTHAHVSFNARRLHEAQRVTEVLNFLLGASSILGYFNLMLCASLIYGIISNSARYILVWLLGSGMTYTTIIGSLAILYNTDRPVADLLYSSSAFKLSIIGLIILIVIAKWCILCAYLLHLRKHLSISQNKKKVFIAYGGFRHTIQPVYETKNPTV